MIAARARALGALLSIAAVAGGPAARAEAPASQPASQPASMPASMPASQPASAPASQPASASEPARAEEQPPPPDQTSGVAIAEAPSIGQRLLWVPRVALYLPTRAIELLFWPFQELSYIWERHQIPKRFTDLFFNDAGTFGIFPVAFVDNGFGLNAGVRLVHRDLFGARETLRLRASFGGMYSQFYSASVDTGERLGRLKLRFNGGYYEGPQHPFYGIGNGDEVSAEIVTGLIDPLADDTAVGASFRQDLAFGKLALDARLWRGLSATLSGEVRYQSFDDRVDGVDISDVYMTDKLACVEDGSFDIYPQLRLSFDNRKGAPHLSSLSASGFYLNGWLGYAKGFRGDPSNHLRYALDLQWFIDLYQGSRILIARLVLDGVTADLGSIPMTDLPSLGGDRRLRGYPHGRFRDRVLTLGSLEYQYNLSGWTTAYLFVDTGRVWRSLSDFRFRAFRMGYGGGLLIHADGIFARVQLASSIDGGLMFNFALDQFYDPPTGEVQR